MPHHFSKKTDEMPIVPREMAEVYLKALGRDASTFAGLEAALRWQSDHRQEEPLRVLWRANILVDGRKDSFLYRSTEEFERAAFIAEALLQSSPAASMVGAVIVGIERQSKLWN